MASLRNKQIEDLRTKYAASIGCSALTKQKTLSTEPFCPCYSRSQDTIFFETCVILESVLGRSVLTGTRLSSLLLSLSLSLSLSSFDGQETRGGADSQASEMEEKGKVKQVFSTVCFFFLLVFHPLFKVLM